MIFYVMVNILCKVEDKVFFICFYVIMGYVILIHRNIFLQYTTFFCANQPKLCYEISYRVIFDKRPDLN